MSFASGLILFKFDSLSTDFCLKFSSKYALLISKFYQYFYFFTIPTIRKDPEINYVIMWINSILDYSIGITFWIFLKSLLLSSDLGFRQTYRSLLHK
jgi:hypothetical protein